MEPPISPAPDPPPPVLDSPATASPFPTSSSKFPDPPPPKGGSIDCILLSLTGKSSATPKAPPVQARESSTQTALPTKVTPAPPVKPNGNLASASVKGKAIQSGGPSHQPYGGGKHPPTSQTGHRSKRLSVSVSQPQDQTLEASVDLIVDLSDNSSQLETSSIRPDITRHKDEGQAGRLLLKPHHKAPKSGGEDQNKEEKSISKSKRRGRHQKNPEPDAIPKNLPAKKTPPWGLNWVPNGFRPVKGGTRPPYSITAAEQGPPLLCWGPPREVTLNTLFRDGK
ncbi:hypothetical protein QJS10_CPB11g01547 [Acorus calamus]|uniref:Uncharacterized protein n=1 Tax=Acorus calamus TaxID=4465 RepID=A0AAV9DS91_ACOCL|nr:hypothetical protein QJS10_CPB11g01547 [Acorus calamus]